MEQGTQCREFIQRKDIGYVASFEPKDAEVFQKKMWLCNYDGRYSINPELKKLDRVYNDQTTDIEPIKVGISGNKLVNEGLVALAEFAIGKRTKRFEYYVIGEGTTPVNIRDTTLDDECARVKITTAGGTFIQRQSTLFYSVFFSKNIADCTVAETGIVDANTQAADRMLLRTVLPANDHVSHRKTFDTVFVAHVIFSGSS